MAFDMKTYQAEWYQRNKVRYAELDRARYESDPEYFKEKALNWRKDNPDRKREINQASRHRHPEIARRTSSTYRARKNAAFVEVVDPLVVLERDDGVCGICNEDVDPLRYDVDHIIPLVHGGKHSYANVQTAHPECNQSKGAKV